MLIVGLLAGPFVPWPLPVCQFVLSLHDIVYPLEVFAADIEQKALPGGGGIKFKVSFTVQVMVGLPPLTAPFASFPVIVYSDELKALTLKVKDVQLSLDQAKESFYETVLKLKRKWWLPMAFKTKKKKKYKQKSLEQSLQIFWIII